MLSIMFFLALLSTVLNHFRASITSKGFVFVGNIFVANTTLETGLPRVNNEVIHFSIWVAVAHTSKHNIDA
jgi:hypothetical protein